MTLREFVEAASAKVEISFKETGQVRAMYHIVTDNEEIALPAPPPPKELAVLFVQHVFKEIGVKRYVFVDEAWVVTMTVPETTTYDMAMETTRKQPPPSEHPDRKECVIFMAEDENEGAFYARRYITRDAKGVGKLGPLETDQPTVSGGQLTGLLPRKGKLQ